MVCAARTGHPQIGEIADSFTFSLDASGLGPNLNCRRRTDAVARGHQAGFCRSTRSAPASSEEPPVYTEETTVRDRWLPQSHADPFPAQTSRVDGRFRCLIAPVPLVAVEPLAAAAAKASGRHLLGRPPGPPKNGRRPSGWLQGYRPPVRCRWLCRSSPPDRAQPEVLPGAERP